MLIQDTFAKFSRESFIVSLVSSSVVSILTLFKQRSPVKHILIVVVTVVVVPVVVVVDSLVVLVEVVLSVVDSVVVLGTIVANSLVTMLLVADVVEDDVAEEKINRIIQFYILHISNSFLVTLAQQNSYSLRINFASCHCLAENALI